MLLPYRIFVVNAEKQNNSRTLVKWTNIRRAGMYLTFISNDNRSQGVWFFF